MTDLTLTKTRLFEGVWEGVLTSSARTNTPPSLEVTHLEQPLAGLELVEDGAGWAVRFSVPVNVIADGVQTFLFRDALTGETLDSFALIGGEALSNDIRAEMNLLREELDMLKRAFRRHCLETM